MMNFVTQEGYSITDLYPTIHIMSGAPGSGKTSYAMRHQQCNSLYISRDDERGRLRYFLHSNRYFPVPASVEYNYWVEEVRLVIIRAGGVVDVWIDQTSCSTESLIKFIKDIASVTMHFKYIFEIVRMTTPLDTCLERNAKRSGFAYVPEDAITKMFNSEVDFDAVRAAIDIPVAVSYQAS